MLEPNAKMQIPAILHPGFRAQLAIERGVEKNILLSTFGGIGDHICAEPTLRYALMNFGECKISLVTRLPELYRHLSFHEVINANELTSNQGWLLDKYIVFNTGIPSEHFVSDFVAHALTNCLDFPSVCAFRLTVPVKDKPVMLHPSVEDYFKVDQVGLDFSRAVIIHPGRHWPSKTFPAGWWEDVMDQISAAGKIPVIIGTAKPGEQGTVDVSGGCDLRDQLTLMQTVALLKQSRVLLTNDSSPLHMAADSRCWIGFVATCKHPDYITHWRRNGDEVSWSWRMKNFGQGGIWDLRNYCPNQRSTVKMDQATPAQIEAWLPHSSEYVAWAVSRLAEP